MKISEIFMSIEGEGVRTGAPSVFVRLFGCNLRCSYCDSMYAVEGNDFREMTITDVIDSIRNFNVSNVTITGGEPLIHPGIQDLLNQLDQQGYEINIETNGTCPKFKDYKNVFYTMDWKSISSGENSKMDLNKLMDLSQKDVVKFVVANPSDLQEASNVIETLENHFKNLGKSLPYFYVSPVFKTMAYEDMVNWILSNQTMVRNKVRFQVQLHKIVWDPNARGV